MRRPRWKTLCLRLVLALGSALLAVVVVELGYRVYQFGWNALFPTEMHSLHRLGRSGLLEESLLEGLRYEHKRSLSTRDHMQPFTTNSLGMRDREYSLTKPANTFRVAMIGDSWTMGLGVAIEDVYHSLIESRLDERGGAIAYEFLNFGVAGYELWDYVGTIEHKVRRFDPDLILVALSGTDQVVRVRGKPPFVERAEVNPFWVLTLLEDFRLQRRIRAKKEQTSRASRNRRAGGQASSRESNKDPRSTGPRASGPRATGPRATGPRATGRPQAQRSDPMPKATMSYLRATFSDLAQACAHVEIPVVVCFLTMGFNPGGRVTKAFAKVCGENDIPYRDLSSAFKGYTPEQFWIFRNDHHPNAAAHAMFADELLEFLQGDGFLQR